ncbi:MAG: hypothetical protein IKW58_03355 [Alphaproteobacteria bacterium]|nr:hypothetical protein [Alphaproteobacteria bacterium]
MKPLLIILKILLIGYLWSIIFIDGIRVVLLINWHFDIFLKEHWQLLKIKWNSGAPISASEVGFFAIVFSAIPIWVAGWYGLSIIKWKKWLKYTVLAPVFLYRKITLKTKPPVVVKKKSVTEENTTIAKTPIIKKAPVKRPPLPSATIMQANAYTTPGAQTASAPTSSYQAPSPKKKQEPSKPIDHALFNFDEDDFDLDFDFEKKEKREEVPSALATEVPETAPAPAESTPNRSEKPHKNQDKPKKEAHNKPKNQDNNTKESHTPVMDVLTQKGYDIISSAIIKNTTIDYIAVSKKELLLCLVDRENGDWLADEEKFNDEEPLWFSESSHRISPVRKIDLARDIIKTKLAVADFNFDIVSYVIIQSGNIINAEDMFDIWNSMNINVTRINRGSPKEIQLFSKSVEACEDKLDKNTFEKLKKLIYSMA